jgi:hypothetical protein
MNISWGALIGTSIGICIFLGPFAFKDRRSKGGSNIRASIDVICLLGIVFLWVAGGRSLLYGLGIVVDEPPEIDASGGYQSAQTHSEHVRVSYLALGVGFIAAAWFIGKLYEKQK